MKILRCFLLLLSPIVPLFSFSCIVDKQNINEQINCHDNNKNLTFKNWFKDNVTQKDQEILRNRITKIINKYRLYEWNNAYEKSNNPKCKSKVLNLSFSDYNSLNLPSNIVQNNIFKKDEIWITNTYKNQDHQFRYFNDFINIINEENSKNEEDFLYLRWLYYSTFAAHKYRTIKVNGKPIYDINLDDWITAATEFITTGNFEPLNEIVNSFLKYYGFSSLKKSNASLVNKSIAHTFLCSIDMVMRFSSKSEDELKHYPLWKLKAKRAKEIFDLTNEKFNLFANSFLPTSGGNQTSSEINDLLNSIKEPIMQLITITLKNLVKVELDSYAIKNQVIKGECNVKNIDG